MGEKGQRALAQGGVCYFRLSSALAWLLVFPCSAHQPKSSLPRPGGPSYVSKEGIQPVYSRACVDLTTFWI